jgi:triacylglycerol lipase
MEPPFRRWRGLKSLVHNAVDYTTRLVEEGHESVSRSVVGAIGVVPSLAAPAHAVDDLRRAVTAGVLGAVRGVNRVVERVTDGALDAAESALVYPGPDGRPDEGGALVPLRSDAMGGARWLGDAAIAALNAAVGDRLHAQANGLEVDLRLRLGDRYLPLAPLDVEAARALLETAPRRVAVLVHGLATTEWSWCLNAKQYWGDPAINFGALLARDHGYTALYARYNTGRHVSENGQRLAEHLEALREALGDELEEILLVGHSMGGLVVRSACHYGREAGHRWPSRVRRVFCLGSPHHGAPLEKIGNVATAVLLAVDTPGTRIPGLLLEGRSAGIKDLRYGNVVHEDWLARDPDALLEDRRRAVPLLDDVTYYFVSATLTRDPEHPLGRVLGDLLVRVPSASGPAVPLGRFTIETHRFGAVLHHELQNHPDVYALIDRALRGDARSDVDGGPPQRRSKPDDGKD